MHKKGLKFALIMELDSPAKIYLYHSSKNTSSRPPLGMSSEHNSVPSFSGSWSIYLLFISDYTKRKLLHVNFKVVDSQKKKKTFCVPALTFILSSKSIWIDWNSIILFFIPNCKLIDCTERQKIERGICHGIKRGFFCRKIFPSAHQYVFRIP